MSGPSRAPRPKKARRPAGQPAKGRARPAEATPCPRCGKAVPVKGERGTCPSCGQAVRFVEVPERPCSACGKPVPLPPGRDAVSCPACGAWQAADPSRPLKATATCPRCRREVEVPLDREEFSCPRCGQAMRLGPPALD